MLDSLTNESNFSWSKLKVYSKSLFTVRDISLVDNNSKIGAYRIETQEISHIISLYSVHSIVVESAKNHSARSTGLNYLVASNTSALKLRHIIPGLSHSDLVLKKICPFLCGMLLYFSTV